MSEVCELAPGLQISRVLTGLWQIADMEREGRRLDLDAAADAIPAYVDAGLTSFDMADHYGSAEDVVGRYLRRHAPGDRVQVLTKWVPNPGPITRQEVRAAVERSLVRLGSERLDLLQFHAWSYADASYLDALFALQELQQEGLIRHLGLTNFDTAHLRVVVASGIEVVSNQVCFSLLDQRPSNAMTALCQEYGIKLLAYGTLAGGLLTDWALGRSEPVDLATWSQMKYQRFLELAGGWRKLQTLLETLASIAERHGVSVANVACRSILDDSAVGGIIIGARLSESQHIAENLRLFQFTLTDRDRTEIDAVLATLQPIPGDCGDEYRKPPFLTASGDLSHHVASFPTPYTPQEAAGGRIRVLSGTPWEPLAGYCRAVRQGNRIWVSGTTATHGDRPIGGLDPAAQTHFVIDKLEGAIVSLGGSLRDVCRTRVFIQNLDQWEAVARAHGERFGEILPANTMVQASLIGEENLVEIEAEALLED